MSSGYINRVAQFFKNKLGRFCMNKDRKTQTTYIVLRKSKSDILSRGVGSV